MKVRSPGKLIISGEHAVVYGRPAIAMAVDHYVETTIIPQSSKSISFNFSSLLSSCERGSAPSHFSAHQDVLDIRELREIKQRLTEKYRLFLNGHIHISEVLQNPFELAEFTFIHFLDHLNLQLSEGLIVSVEFNIPIHCGMGASAAMIVGILKMLVDYFEVNLSEEECFCLGRKIENLQHGVSSGIDIYTSLHGGCIYFKAGSIQDCRISNIPMNMINTGAPEMSTGECVEVVARKFKSDHSIWNDFESVTNEIKKAMEVGDLSETQYLIRENHRLLKEIGVVPNEVCQFIKNIEKNGGAAKICGAGAVAGKTAGMVLVIQRTEDE